MRLILIRGVVQVRVETRGRVGAEIDRISDDMGGMTCDGVVRRALVVAAGTAAALGAGAPVAMGDPGNVGGNVGNYGRCVSMGLVDPSASHDSVGPLTFNANNMNIPNDGHRLGYAGCQRPPG